MRLAGQDEAAGHLVLVQGEVALHAHLALDHLGAAGAAHARGAGVRHLQARRRGRVQDAGLAARERDLAREAVAHQHDAGGFGIAGPGLVDHGPYRCAAALGLGQPEALDVDAVLGHAGGQQGGLGLVVHLEGSANVDMVDVRGRHHALQEFGDLGAVHHAHVQRQVGVLVREHMLQRQPRHVAVLEVLDLLLEHGGLQLAVAVDQREAAGRLARQHGLHDGQDGRDAAAARNAHVVARGPGLDGHEEAALGRHDLQGVAGPQVLVDPVGELAAAHLAHAHAQLAVIHACADGVAAAQVLAVDLVAQRQVLALGEAEDLAQLARHIEADTKKRLAPCLRAMLRTPHGSGTSGLVGHIGPCRPWRRRPTAARCARWAQCGQGTARAPLTRLLHQAMGAVPAGSPVVPAGDAVFAQLAPAVVADPVRGPGRGAAQHGARGAQACGLDGLEHAALDDLGGRAARVGGPRRPRSRAPRSALCRAGPGQALALGPAQKHAAAAITTPRPDRRAAGAASRPGLKPWCSLCTPCAPVLRKGDRPAYQQ
ncbi:hypothetical protein FQR65_LT20496 [Abscondita terminalis]|nr:hypothetical protein FQR65_LT20496 [Abscondita terminalis]